jgi:hypothetical protein
VSDSAEQASEENRLESRGGSIHVEFPGRALVSIEAGVDPVLAAAIIHHREAGAVIELPKGTRIWIVAGTTDMRRGFDGFSSSRAFSRTASETSIPPNFDFQP